MTSRETVVDLIASTTTRTGLTVRCELDTRDYPKGIKVGDAEMMTLNIKGDTFHHRRGAARAGLHLRHQDRPAATNPQHEWQSFYDCEALRHG